MFKHGRRIFLLKQRFNKTEASEVKYYLYHSQAEQIRSKRFTSTLSYIHNPVSDPLRPLTIGKLLEKTCQKHGETTAIISCEQNLKYTYNEILNQADKLAAGLKNLDLNYGDRVGLWAPNLVEWYISFLACARAGLTTVGINPFFQAKEIEYCINKVGIKAIISGHIDRKQNYYEILNKVVPNLGVSKPGQIHSKNVPDLKSIIMISNEELKGTFSYNNILNASNQNDITNIKNQQNKIKCDDSFNIQFTSGTTGKPKAACVSHFNLSNNGYFIGKRNELHKKQRKICVQVPFFHAYGTSITISASVNYGSTLVLPSASYNPDKNLEAIKNEECSIIHGTPTMYVDLVNRQMERKLDINPEIAVSGGAICSPHLFKQMKKHLRLKKVKSVYGLSETTAVIFQSMEDDDEYKSTCTVGHVSEHVEAKVVDTEGNIVPRGTPGELLVRAYSNMLGYMNDEEKTKETIGDDRWLKTGDQFVLEENGYGRVVGRLKDMIIRGGENIFPREIEDYLNTHPNILETQVIGVPHERLGEEICACIRVTEGAKISVEDIKLFCKENLSSFKVPRILEIIDNFPKTTSGKIQKFKILELYKQKHKL